MFFGVKNKSILNKKKISNPIGHQETHSARRKRDISAFVGWTGRAKFTPENGGKVVNNSKHFDLSTIKADLIDGRWIAKRLLFFYRRNR